MRKIPGSRLFFLTIVTVIIVSFFSVASLWADTNKKELVMISSCVPALDPVYDYTAGHLHIVKAIEYLTRITPNGEIKPELALSYQSLDKNTWEVKLRANVTFWSGKTMDAKAAKASLERARKFAPEAKDLLAGVTIIVIDPLTLHFVTKHHDPGLPVNLSSKWLAIHNADNYGDKPAPYDLSRLDATGMYRVVNYVPRQKIVYEKWSGYWGKKPAVNRIVYKAVSDPQSRLLGALSGEADIVLAIPSEGGSVIKASQDKDLLVIKGPDIYYIYLNFNYGPLQDIRVRQALAWGIDRNKVVDMAISGFGTPAPTWYAQNPLYPEAKDMGYRRYDPEKSKKLLTEAGWIMDNDAIRKKDGKPLSLRFFATNYHRAIGPVIQSQWKKLGIQVSVEYGDSGFREAKLASGDWETGFGGMGSFGDPRAVLLRQFGPDGYRNFSGYNNDTMNNIIEQLGRTSDKKARHALAIKANNLIAETVPIIPIFTKDALVAVNKNITGLKPHFIWWLYLFTDAIDLKE